eukprot:scaffold972_cov155-Pinguiococcus_pyrenoidosus.AAC.2
MWSGGSGRSRERCDRSRSRLAAARSSRLRVEIARGTLRSSTSMHPSMPRRTRPRVQSAASRAPVSAAALPRSAPGHSHSRT